MVPPHGGVAFEGGLGVVASVAEFDGADAADAIAEVARHEDAATYAALVYVVVFSNAVIGLLPVPNVEDGPGWTLDFHQVLGDFGVVDAGAQVEFEAEQVAEVDGFADGEVDVDTAFCAEHAAADVAVLCEDDGRVVAVKIECAYGLQLGDVEAEQPAEAAGVLVAYAEPHLVGCLVVHVGIFRHLEVVVGADGGADAALVLEVIPNGLTVAWTVEDTLDGVGVAVAAGIEVGRIVVGPEGADVYEDGQSGVVGCRRAPWNAVVVGHSRCGEHQQCHQGADVLHTMPPFSFTMAASRALARMRRTLTVPMGMCMRSAISS